MSLFCLEVLQYNARSVETLCTRVVLSFGLSFGVTLHREIDGRVPMLGAEAPTTRVAASMIVVHAQHAKQNLNISSSIKFQVFLWPRRDSGPEAKRIQKDT